MPKNKKQQRLPFACVQLYNDFRRKAAGCFSKGSQREIASLLIVHAQRDETFYCALFDACAHLLKDEE